MIKINLINDATLYQWDTKRKLKISGKANIEEVHFSTLTSTNALVVTPKDNIVNIPSVLLQTGEDILVYLVEVNGDSKQIVAYKELNVCPRAKPDDYIYTEDEVFSYDKLEEQLGLLEKDVIKDIQIDNKSIVNEEKIVNIPVAADGALGVVKTGLFGIKTDKDGALMVDAANKTDINEKNQYKPITANNLEYAVQMGLISNEENLRLNEQEKEIIRNKLGTVGFSNELHGEVFNDYENNIASGEYSHAEGSGTQATGLCSHAEGGSTTAKGAYSHAEGCNDDRGWAVDASGMASHAEGRGTWSNAIASHTEGWSTEAHGNASHAEGKGTKAYTEGSHAEGKDTKAGEQNGTKSYAHAEGVGSQAYGQGSHAEGKDTLAQGDYSHAEGIGTNASSSYQHVQGKWNAPDTENKYAHIVGNGDSDNNRSNAHTVDWDGNAWFAGAIKVGGTSQDDANAVEVALKSDLSNLNLNSKAIVDVVSLPETDIDEDVFYRLLTAKFIRAQIHIARWTCNCVESLPETGETCFSGDLADVNNVIVVAYYNISDGNVYAYASSDIAGLFGVPAGWYPISTLMNAVGYTFSGVVFDRENIPADNDFRVLLEYEIYSYKKSWTSSKSIGKPGTGDEAERFNSITNIASGVHSHAEGYNTTASGSGSHAEGYKTIASGVHSHAEGYNTIASGSGSHAEGYKTIASGNYSHAEGSSTIASRECQHVQGKYNIEDAIGAYVHIVGNGNSNTRSNAHTLDWDGNAWFAGKVTIGPDNKELATKDDIATDEVYVGSGEMPEGYVLQIDPAGEASGIVEDVKINDTSVVQDGVADIPEGGYDKLGLLKVYKSDIDSGISTGYLGLRLVNYENHIKNRNYNLAITNKNLDYAVKAAMSDGKGPEWTREEQQAAQERLGFGWKLLGDITVEEEGVTVISIPVDSTYNEYRFYAYANRASNREASTMIVCFDDVTSTAYTLWYMAMTDQYPSYYLFGHTIRHCNVGWYTNATGSTTGLPANANKGFASKYYKNGTIVDVENPKTIRLQLLSGLDIGSQFIVYAR